MPHLNAADSDLDSDEEEDYETESPKALNSSSSSNNTAHVPVASMSAWRNSGINAAVIVRETLAGEIKFIDIDEQSVPWKRRHECRCYNPAKPEKLSVQDICLNDMFGEVSS
jgi:hypothetical protein